MRRKEMYLVLIGLLYSSLIALMAYGFMMVEKWGSHLLWETLPHHLHAGPLYSLVVIGSLCVLVFFLKRSWGNLPRTSHELLHELGEKGTVAYRHTWHNLVLALLILVSGAGVGPEAPLLGAIIAYSIWQADKLRYLVANWDQLAGLGFKQGLVRIFHPTDYLLVYPTSQRQIGKSLRNVLIANGLLVFWLMMRLTDQPSFVTKLGETDWSLTDLMFLLPLCLYGFAIGRGYSWLKGRIFTGLERLNLALVAKIGLGAVGIFLMTVRAPALLFSGQHSLHTVVELGMKTPVLVLLGLSLVKLLFLNLCVWSGWTGGDVFPVTFAAFLQGFAVAQLLPQVDSLFVVLVVSLSMAISLLGKEWLAGIFISLFFPLPLFPVSLVVIWLFLLWKKVSSGERFGRSRR